MTIIRDEESKRIEKREREKGILRYYFIFDAVVDVDHDERGSTKVPFHETFLTAKPVPAA